MGDERWGATTQSFTAKVATDAKELKSLTAKIARDAKDEKSFTAKAAKESIFENQKAKPRDAKTTPREVWETRRKYAVINLTQQTASAGF